MAWIEHIILRAPLGDAASLQRELAAFTEGLDTVEGLLSASVHRHASIRGDYLVLLVWDEPLAARGSKLGLYMAASLARIGLVDHAVWPGQGE